MTRDTHHEHGPGCGHLAVRHEEHVDWLRDGRLEPSGGGAHVLGVDEQHPDICTPRHACGNHPEAHRHGPGCGHPEVRHGDHVDYLVGGHLHRPHLDHCDDHGPLRPA